MNLTFSLKYRQTDEYLIRLSSVCLADFLSEDVSESISKNHEIIEIGLQRIKGEMPTNVVILSQITNFIAKIFEQNKHFIFYFFCDDLNDVARRRKDFSPQEYRSILFTRMIDKYLADNHISDIEHTTVCIDSSGWKNYIHFVYRSNLKTIVDLLQADIIDNYGK